MDVAASDVYEIVLEQTASPKQWFRTALTVVLNLAATLTMSDGPVNPGGQIISVRNKQTGEELFRHIEDMGDDEGHLLHGIENDLATMTAEEFASSWG